MSIGVCISLCIPVYPLCIAMVYCHCVLPLCMGMACAAIVQCCGGDGYRILHCASLWRGCSVSTLCHDSGGLPRCHTALKPGVLRTLHKPVHHIRVTTVHSDSPGSCANAVEPLGALQCTALRGIARWRHFAAYIIECPLPHCPTALITYKNTQHNQDNYTT